MILKIIMRVILRTILNIDNDKYNRDNFQDRAVEKQLLQEAEELHLFALDLAIQRWVDCHHHVDHDHDHHDCNIIIKFITITIIIMKVIIIMATIMIIIITQLW